MRNVTRVPFTKALRKQGFKRIDAVRDPLIYHKTVGDRKICIQLWMDGNHTASHYLNSVMSTQPTKFKTVNEMYFAIAEELARNDHSAWEIIKA